MLAETPGKLGCERRSDLFRSQTLSVLLMWAIHIYTSDLVGCEEGA